MTQLSASELRLEELKHLSNSLFRGEVAPLEAKRQLDNYIIETEKDGAGIENSKRETYLTLSPAEDLRTIMLKIKAGTITNQEIWETLDCIVAVLEEESDDE